MRIQEKIEASATCAKMTEEKSVNGVCEVPAAAVSKRARGYVLDGVRPVRPRSVDPDTSHAFAGGRLKFFKDGKSILELSYRRDGDRMCWVSNWPVPGGTRQESSAASLSVSDDNSSVQSSPWQRDHNWKQASPRRGRGAHLQFLMRPLNAARKIRRLSFISRSIRRKRRRPYDAADMNAPLIKEEDADDSFNSSMNSTLNSSKTPSKGKLPGIVQNLLDRVKTNEPSRPIIPSGRVDPNIISPRKRILREMERVSIDESSNKRPKQRLSQGNGSASSNNSTVTCHTLHPAGAPPPVKTAASSYSITSLLAPREEETVVSKETEPSFLRNLLKSPSSQSGSDVSETNSKVKSVSKSGSVRKMSPPQQQPVTLPTLSPSPGLRSPAIPSAVGGAAHYAPYIPTHPLIYPHCLTPHPATHPAYYTGYAPPHSPGPPLWIPYMSSLQGRAAMYPGLAPTYHSPMAPSPWGAPINHQPHLDDLRKEDDMPLNLSKHAG